jgi:periplasmic mercuric ion binding protein
MKFIQLIVIAILFSFSYATAQKKATGKAIIKTPGITCEICKDRVEHSLFKMYGITSIKADFKKHITTVTWLTDRTNIEEIKTAIANAGYDADDVRAEDDAYKRLPTGCKKPIENVAKPAPAPVKAEPVLNPVPLATNKTSTNAAVPMPNKSATNNNKKPTAGLKKKVKK